MCEVKEADLAHWEAEGRGPEEFVGKVEAAFIDLHFSKGTLRSRMLLLGSLEVYFFLAEKECFIQPAKRESLFGHGQ